MLLDYQSGRFNLDHKSEVMMDLMKVYDQQQMADIAEYYAAQSLPQAKYAPEASTVSKETIRLITKGDVSRMIVPCASCHGAKGEGGMNEPPALTGMSPRMFIRHMKAYQSGKRHNDVNSGMAQFTTDLTDAEIQALADYYASFITKEWNHEWNESDYLGLDPHIRNHCPDVVVKHDYGCRRLITPNIDIGENIMPMDMITHGHFCFLRILALTS